MTGRLLTILAVLVLNFIGTIFLETKLEQHATLELVIVVVGIILSIIALIGIAAESRWSWPFATILFSLSLANVLFLHVNIGAMGTFLALLAVNIFGMLIAIISIEDVASAVGAIAPDSAPLETYAEEEPAQVTYEAESKAKKGRKRKR